MLKIGMIGLGDIAQKAYLPVISKMAVELHVYSRNASKLSELGKKYRYHHLHSTIEGLLQSGIRAAFVHTSTESHFEIAEKLLNCGIHVYVDKPLTYDYKSSAKLSGLADSKKLILMTGFNRRYAPPYARLRSLPDINMVLMQKNRKSLPADLRTFIFDDFIHVVDTLRFLFPDPVKELIVKGRKKDGLLHHVTLQLAAENGATAIGIMNRDAGTVEERLEVFTASQKRVVINVSEEYQSEDKNETRLAGNDWESTLHKRGFEQIVTDFLSAVEKGISPGILNSDSLATHEMCEKIVERLL